MKDSVSSARSQAARRTNSLLINVSTLLQESIGSVRHYALDDATCAPLGADSPLNGDLRLLRTDHSILATARISTIVPEICGGCLEETPAALRIAFDEEFWPPSDPVSGMRLEPPPEREGFAVADGQIDLTEAVRQYVEMARPMSPRCGPTCPGMGADESASDPLPDARWAALAALRRELGE